MLSCSGPRIAVTGMGVVSVIGTGYAAFWQAALSGRSGFSPVRLFDTAAYRCHIAAEVRDFDPAQHLTPTETATLGRQSQMALAAARMAVADAGIDLRHQDRHKIACAAGLLVAEPVMHQHLVEQLDNRAPMTDLSPQPYAFPWTSPAASVVRALDLEGPCQSVYCACAGGNYALAWGCELIRQGVAGMALIGGAEAFNQATFTGFHQWRSLAPERCQPFCKGRKGLIVGEGAAFMVIEPVETALANGRNIHARVLGHGLSCDAHHLTAPHPDGEGAARAVRAALADAGLTPEHIDYVSAHGTGTEANDRIETRLLKEIFGSHSRDLVISSIKSMIGHPMGAASAIEAIVCCLAVSRDQVPPTMHLDDPDPACDLDYAANRAVAKPIRCAMNNAFGFGGINAVVIFGKHDSRTP